MSLKSVQMSLKPIYTIRVIYMQGIYDPKAH